MIGKTMYKSRENIYGRDVVKTLAKTYQQLYVAPGEEGEKKYADIVKCGRDAESRDLSHFRMNDADSLVYEDTPAGSIRVVTLHEREDFVTFLRIMGNRCAMADIPDTQGAVILDGVINWEKIHDHEREYINSEADKGKPSPDWGAEFRRFTSVRENYLDAIIVLSVGPYSGISTEKINGYFIFGGHSLTDKGNSRALSPEEWQSLSDTIRRYHECTHFICRRKYPDEKDAIWDELVADAVGIYAAFNRFDPGIEELFLGIENGRYTGGRLENYIEADTREDKERRLDELASGIIPILDSFRELIAANTQAGPYDIAILLEENKKQFFIKG